MRRIRLVLSLALALATAGSAAIRRAEAAEPADRSSAQSEEPKIELRPTYGPEGSTRPAEVIAGEPLYVTVTTSNLGVEPGGKLVDFALEWCMVDAKGTNVLGFNSVPVREPLSFGGTDCVVFLTMPISRDTAPGVYFVRARSATTAMCSTKTGMCSRRSPSTA